MATRRASHAGTWYCSSARELDWELKNWMDAAELTHGPARAIIAPHAAYQYCGACAAFAYRQVSPALVKRIFILGPSHHFRLSGCALSRATNYAAPFYDLTIDQEVYEELKATGMFGTMTLSVDEAEHSIEMHLPYIAKVMDEFKESLKIVPILVGSLNRDEESLYGHILAPYLADPQNLFVVSSDFCHWGHRFGYTFYDKDWGQIHQSIQMLDQTGMDIIEKLDPAAFSDYLKKYGNTICGRHPIGVLLQAISHAKSTFVVGKKLSLKFLKYAQSNQCFNMTDSSVSYASAALVIE